jgi:hypothetical protein
MSKYSGESLESRITALEQQALLVCRSVNALSPNAPLQPLLPQIPPQEKKPTWSEAHTEPSDPVGTIKPYINAFGEESDSLVLIRQNRGWETRMKSDVTNAQTRVQPDTTSTAEPSAQQAD